MPKGVSPPSCLCFQRWDRLQERYLQQGASREPGFEATSTFTCNGLSNLPKCSRESTLGMMAAGRSRYPGNKTLWNDNSGKPWCGCFDGLQWNLAGTQWVTSDVRANELCARDLPGSVPTGRDADSSGNNRWKTLDGYAGSWRCRSDGSVVVTPDQGAKGLQLSWKVRKREGCHLR